MSLRPLFEWMAPGGANARLSILIFHRVLASPDPLFPGEPDVRRFDEILGWVGRWLQVLPLDEAVRRLREGNLPPRAAAITFDDGYADNATNALPVLQRHGMTATFFIANSFLDGGRMWNDTVIESLRHARPGSYNLGQSERSLVEISDLASRRAAIDALLSSIKYLVPAERSIAAAHVRETLAVTLSEQLMMTSAQVRQLRDAGMRIGAHTSTHPILARTPDDVARSEIAGGKVALEELLGEAVTLFAYPNGKPGRDYLPCHVEMVRNAGFAAAVSTQAGISTTTTDCFELPRFTPWDRGRLRFGARVLRNLWSSAPASVSVEASSPRLGPG